jgi:hypothetical protein
MKQSHEEIVAGDPYYDFDIAQIRTMAHVHVNEADSHQKLSDRKAWVEGWFLDTALGLLMDTDEWCLNNRKASVLLAVRDNGPDGAGLRLDIDIEPDSTTIRPTELASIRLSPRQAFVLAQSLLSAVALRETTE